MRTALSDEQVATIGRVGWAAVSQAREREGGVRGDRGAIVPANREVISSLAGGVILVNEYRSRFVEGSVRHSTI